jgi:hypothetical protein
MGSGIDVIELDPGQLQFDFGVPAPESETVYYDTPDAVAAGNLDIISGFNPQPINTARGSGQDVVRYDSALGTDVYWYNDASGDLLMANSQGIFAKFIGVSAADMDSVFSYV